VKAVDQGLGLAIVSSIAEAHGGTTRVETAPGRARPSSSIFPLADASTLAAAPVPIEDRPDAPRQI